MPFDNKVQDCIEKGMAGTDEGRERLALRCDQRLLEDDALVSGQNRLANADQSVAIANRRWDMRYLETAGFALTHRAVEALERLKKEGLDVMGLETPSFRPLHLLADAEDTAGVHRVMGERVFFDQLLQLFPVECVGDDPGQSRPHFWLVAVADGFDEQLP